MNLTDKQRDDFSVLYDDAIKPILMETVNEITHLVNQMIQNPFMSEFDRKANGELCARLCVNLMESCGYNLDTDEFEGDNELERRENAIAEFTKQTSSRVITNLSVERTLLQSSLSRR